MVKEKMLKLVRTNTASSRALWFTMGSMLIRGISIFTAPVFTRLLSPAQFGEYSLFLVWATLLALICSLYTHGAISVAHTHLQPSQWKGFLSSIYVLSSLSFVIFSAAMLVFGKEVSMALQIRREHLPWLLAYGFFQFVINAKLSTLAQEKKPRQYFVLSMLVMLGSIALSLLLVFHAQDRLSARISGQVLPSACIAIVLYLLTLKRGKTFFALRHWRYALTISLPLIFLVTFFFLPPQSNRIMLNVFGFANASGIYSFAYAFGAILEDIFLACNMSWVPVYYEHLHFQRFQQAEEQGFHHARTLSLITVGFLLVSPEVYRLLSAPSYWDGVYMLIIIALTAYVRFLINFPLNYALYKKKTGWILPMSLLALSINILGNILLIPRLGGIGAAMATLLSYLVLLCMLGAMVRRSAGLPYHMRVGWHPLLVAVSAAVVFCTLGIWWLRWGLAVFCGCMLLRQLIRRKGLF